MDGEHLVLDDASFDVALSRLGLVYFPDRLGALREMRRVLKQDGRVAITSFTTPEANRFFSIPIGVIHRRAQLPPPPPGLPGPFSLGLQEVMEETLRQAGFRDIQTRTIRPRCGCPRRPNASASNANRSGRSSRCWSGWPSQNAKPLGTRSSGSCGSSRTSPVSRHPPS